MELQNFYFLSEHKSGQMQLVTLQPMVLLWSLYPLAGNLTSVDRLTFCRPIRNVVCYIQKADAVSKISAGWLQAVFLTAFSPHFLFHPWFSFGVAGSLTPWNRKEKYTPKRSPATHATKSQSITYFNRNCCVQLFKCWMVLSTGWITIKWITQLVSPYLYIHWIMISVVDSTIHLLNNKGLYLCDLKTKRSKWKVIVSGVNARQKDTCLMVHQIVYLPTFSEM